MKPKIVIIAGGLATRMGHHTEKIPKCLININGKPLIQHQIDFFKKNGFTDFVFCVAHLADKVKEYFGDGKKYGVNIGYSEESEELLGTAGSVGLLRGKINDVIIVYYGDVLTDMNFDDVLRFHREKGSDFTITARKLPDSYISSSIILIDNDGRLKLFSEKPQKEEFDRYNDEKRYINNGIYIINPDILGEIPIGKKYDFSRDLIPRLVDKGKKIYVYVLDGFFREIGRVEKYDKFRKEFGDKKVIL